MGKTINFIGLSIFWMLTACENETLDPRTNPRFSVALIQEISANGVQFGANVYEFGGEDILEYGFVYTANSVAPNLNTDDYVSAQGRPEAYFELMANHSLTLGRKYYVSAFLRTSSGLIFSESMEFVSQGSDGFLVKSVEWPDIIYKDQKLLVKGSRFSRQKNNYKIKLGIFDVYPEVLDTNTISIDLPVGLLTQTTGQDLETELQIEIGEKRYTEKRVLRFQEPIFETQAIQVIDFDEEVIIKGDFLDLGPISIKVNNQLINGLIASRNEFRFFPYKGTGLKPTMAEPEITFSVRGKNYELGKVFRIKGPEIKGEKVILNKNSQVIPAVNFDLDNLADIQFFDESGEEINLEIIDASTSGIVVNSQRGVYPARNFKMQIKSFGILSNFVEFEITNPVVLLKGKEKQYRYIRNDLSLVSNGNAYILTNEGVIEETLDGMSTQQKIADLPANFNQRVQFIHQVVEGGFVIGGGGNVSNQPFYDLYYFSLEKLQWEKLPNLPAPYTSFKLVTSKNGFLVFEEAKKLFDEVVGEKWTLNLQSKIWERLPTEQSRFFNLQAFYDKGETYIFGLEYSNASRVIYKMKNDFTWEVHFPTPNFYENSEFGTPLVIEGKYYILSYRLGYIMEFDLNTKTSKAYSYPINSFYGDVPVVYSGGVYILSGGTRGTIYEDIRFDLF